MAYTKALEDVISAWSRISIHRHRFGGREFLFGSAEVGHVHANGIVDIPFTRPVHDLLLAEGLAEQHRWVPNSGWITFHIRSEQDVAHAPVVPTVRSQGSHLPPQPVRSRVRGTAAKPSVEVPARAVRAQGHKGSVG